MSSLSDKIDVAIEQMTIEDELAAMREALKDCEARSHQIEIQLLRSNNSSRSKQLLDAYVSNREEQKRVTDRFYHLITQTSRYKEEKARREAKEEQKRRYHIFCNRLSELKVNETISEPWGKPSRALYYASKAMNKRCQTRSYVGHTTQDAAGNVTFHVTRRA